ATRVPTTLARSISTPPLAPRGDASRGSAKPSLYAPALLAAAPVELLLDLALAAEREDQIHVEVRAGEDVRGDDLPDPPGACLAGVDRGLHGRHVAPDDRGDVAAARLLVPDELDLGGLDHGVGRLDHRRERARFNHSQCIGHHSPPAF